MVDRASCNDDKTNRLVVPHYKISDIPYSRPSADRIQNYRAFKIQFPIVLPVFDVSYYAPSHLQPEDYILMK